MDLYRPPRGAHLQAQGMVDRLRDPLLVLDADLTVISANAAFYQTFETHRDATVGVPLQELGSGQWDIDDLRFLLAKVIPKSASVFDYEVTATFPALGQRTMLLSAQRLVHPEIGRRVLLLTIVDATERRRQEEEREIVVGELHHRMKNLVTVTKALARQTRTEGRTAEEYRTAFLGRFDALTKILEVSAQESTAELTALARTVLEPYIGKRGAVAFAGGPMINLSSSQTMPLGMILHEFATNALKYGALSVPDGQVTLDWWTADDDEGTTRVFLRWRESGGPEVVPPTATGFGTRMIQFAAQRDLGGGVEHSYEPEGFEATLTFPQR